MAVSPPTKYNSFCNVNLKALFHLSKKVLSTKHYVLVYRTALPSLRGKRKQILLSFFSENIKGMKKIIIFLESCYFTAPVIILGIKKREF
jgi:hypothetical protein